MLRGKKSGGELEQQAEQPGVVTLPWQMKLTRHGRHISPVQAALASQSDLPGTDVLHRGQSDAAGQEGRRRAVAGDAAETPAPVLGNGGTPNNY